MKFTANNSEFFILPLIFIGIVTLSAIYTIRHKKNKLEKILSTSIIIFLITYFPIVEYWSVWTSWSFWPSDFFYSIENTIPSDNQDFEYYPKLSILYNILVTTSNFLFFFSAILFIAYINTKLNIKNKLINWIPLFNIFNIGFHLNKLFSSKSIDKLLVISWSLFSVLGLYYKCFAGSLFFLGFDSVSLIDNILFSEQNLDSETNELTYNIGYTYIADILNIVTPTLIYISGVLTFIILKKLKKAPLN